MNKNIQLPSLIILMFVISAMNLKTISNNYFIILLKTKLELFNKTLPKEKTHLHLDKPSYFPCDEI